MSDVECMNIDALWTVLLEVTLADLHNAHDDDEAEGEEFVCGEHILYTHRPADTEAVNPS